ncbi:MAG TPA: SDR family oxidoreductase [Candidatus Limnocylindria bacterium]|nr:SDR family oxidoreductase [Candidatus Limnocylindria bacterium]
MKILVTGAAGMLGSALVPALAAAGHDVQPTDIDLRQPRPWRDPAIPEIGKLDVRSREDIARWIATSEPELIVHLGAETDVETCESRPDHAWETNALGTKHVAIAALDAGVPLAYVSTAGVFDGDKEEPYVEYDPAYPINYYGKSKYEGERYVQTFLSRFYVVRAGWMVGGGPKDHKFVAKMLEQIDGGARTLYAVGDKLGTPTYAPDFAGCFVDLIASGSYGLYHMACKGRASRYDVARKILQVLGRTDIELVEVDSSFFAATYPTRRPRSEMMRNLMLDMQGMNRMRDWEVALEEYLAAAFADLRAGAKLA